jgi:hypothetical protein
VQGEKGQHKIEGAVGERNPGGVTAAKIGTVAQLLFRKLDHRRREIDASNLAPSVGEELKVGASATTDLENPHVSVRLNQLDDVSPQRRAEGLNDSVVKAGGFAVGVFHDAKPMRRDDKNLLLSIIF